MQDIQNAVSAGKISVLTHFMKNTLLRHYKGSLKTGCLFVAFNFSLPLALRKI